MARRGSSASNSYVIKVVRLSKVTVSVAHKCKAERFRGESICLRERAEFIITSKPVSTDFLKSARSLVLITQEIDVPHAKVAPPRCIHNFSTD
jgi:hypothetical protein